MFKVTEYVPASKIWPDATDYVDNGYKYGFARRYNVEVTTREGKVDWMSCVYIRATIEEYMEDQYTQLFYQDCGVTPTGRICFRGYGEEVYDDYYREMVIHSVGQL